MNTLWLIRSMLGIKNFNLNSNVKPFDSKLAKFLTNKDLLSFVDNPSNSFFNKLISIKSG